MNETYAEKKRMWWSEPKDDAHAQLIKQVQAIESRQSRTFEKFVRLEALYDPNGIRAEIRDGAGAEALGRVTENVVASNVDTVTAAIAATDVRARFQTDDADWSHQRTARHLEWYAEQLSVLLDINEKCRRAFKPGAVKGTGIVWVDVDASAPMPITVDVVPIDEIVVDEGTAHDGQPLELYRRYSIDREKLKVRYPGNDDEIDAAQTGANRTWRMWSGHRLLDNNEIVVVHGIRLPIGRKGQKGYRPGREVVCVDGATIVDAKYEKTFFPCARFVWSDPLFGWYGIGGAERIAGHQRALNKRNLQIDRQLDQGAVPTTYVSMVDAQLAVKTQNRLGTIAVYKGEKPVTVFPPAVSGETYQSRNDLKQAAFEEFGGNRLAAQSMKPAGIDSGVALREYRDQTSQRFALQERGFERLVLDTIWLVLDRCKDLGDKAPTVMLQSRFGAKKIPWSKVAMADVRVSIAAASTLSRTPAGREQAVIEWAQAGVISQDEARRLIRHPDLERAMSIYTAALESVEQALEEIADGEVVMPEPFMNLAMCVWRGQLEYLNWVQDGAPEERLEDLRQFVVQAAWMQSQAEVANQNAMAPGAAAGAQAAPPPGQAGGDMPPLPGAPPTNGAATSAFSPQAMQLVAGH